MTPKVKPLRRLFGILMPTLAVKWKASQRRQQRKELWYVKPGLSQSIFKWNQFNMWRATKSYCTVLGDHWIIFCITHAVAALLRRGGKDVRDLNICVHFISRLSEWGGFCPVHCLGLEQRYRWTYVIILKKSFCLSCTLWYCFVFKTTQMTT